MYDMSVIDADFSHQFDRLFRADTQSHHVHLDITEALEETQ